MDCICGTHDDHANCRAVTDCRSVGGYTVTFLACDCAPFGEDE